MYVRFEVYTAINALSRINVEAETNISEIYSLSIIRVDDGDRGDL
jgi:hypothetical protein